MHLRIELAGHVAAWRFPGSRALEDWLAWKPWATEGGVAVVRVGASSDVPDLVCALKRSVYGIDAAGTNVSTRLIAVPEGREALVGALCQALEVFTSGGRRSILLALATALRASCLVFFIDLTTFRDAPSDALDALDALRDDLAKVPTPALLTAVALVRSGGARSSFEFVRGTPVDHPLELIGTGLGWRGYLHTRLAWECAGEPSRAQRWASKIPVEVGEEDDEAFELLLNRQADLDWDEIDKGLRTQFTTWIDEPSTSLSERLEADGLLWCPGPMAPRRPPPWAARAQLRCTDGQGSRWRSAMICTPLAEAIVGACFEFEARHRARNAPRGFPRQESIDAWEQFHNGHVSNERRHYPKVCRAMPLSAWDMASLGEHLNASSPPKGQGPTLQALRILRNAMAHGHYASWHTVRELRMIVRTLAET